MPSNTTQDEQVAAKQAVHDDTKEPTSSGSKKTDDTSADQKEVVISVVNEDAPSVQKSPEKSQEKPTVKSAATHASTNAPQKEVPKKEIPFVEISVIKDIPSMDTLIDQVPELPQYEIGDLLEGRVVSVDKGQIVVDIDSMCTGVILGEDMDDSAGTAKKAQPDDLIQAVVIQPENEQGQLVLSLKRASQENTWEHFQKAYEAGKIVEMEMKEANKGGLLIEIDGIRGFLPVSQLTPEHYPRVSGADPSKILQKLNRLVNKKLKVKIINIDYNERRLIISEKEAYHDERQTVIDELKVGQTIEGTVSGVVNFGIFINYKGVEGLIHISEIAWGHVSDPSDYAQVGDKIRVLVIGVEGDKISFSMKRLTPDPWIAAAEKYKIDQLVKGVVTRITPFGAFVKLDDEIDGLIHVSELSEASEAELDDDSKEATDALNLVDVGSEVEARIVSIDVDEHRLGLSIKAESAGKKKAKKKAEVEEDTSTDEKEVKDDDAEADDSKKEAETETSEESEETASK